MERRLNGIEKGRGLLSLSTNRAFKGFLLVVLLMVSVVGVSGFTTENKEELINSFNISTVESDLKKYISDTYGDELHSISWGAAYLVGSLFRMYNATGELKYVDLAVNSCKRIMNLRDDKRGVYSRRNADGTYIQLK